MDKACVGSCGFGKLHRKRRFSAKKSAKKAKKTKKSKRTVKKHRNIRRREYGTNMISLAQNYTGQAPQQAADHYNSIPNSLKPNNFMDIDDKSFAFPSM